MLRPQTDSQCFSRIRTTYYGLGRAGPGIYEPDRQSLEVRRFLFEFGLVQHIGCGAHGDAHSLHVLHWEFGGARGENEVYGMHEVQVQGKQRCALLFPVTSRPY
jgi:hypothetical protein